MSAICCISMIATVAQFVNLTGAIGEFGDSLSDDSNISLGLVDETQVIFGIARIIICLLALTAISGALSSVAISLGALLLHKEMTTTV